jgi:hypothetical protein
VTRSSSGNSGDDVSQLEEQIERLATSVENCRKIIFISRIVIIGGAAWLLAIPFGVIGLRPMSILGAISLVVFGIVSFGSNWSTLRQSLTALKELERRRKELIGRLNLRAVESGK